MAKKTAALASVGCKVSKYEANAMAECLKAGGYEIVAFKEKASIYIINTCTVTNTGDKKSRQLIRRAKQLNKDAVVVVAGCYSQVSPQEVSDIMDADIIVGTKGHTEITKIIDNYLENGGIRQNLVTDISTATSFESAFISNPLERVRAYVKIEDGCDNFCSYCIIPYARGRVRSRQLDDVIEEVTRLCLNGINEIVLTGIHVASYGKDLECMDLLKLIKAAHGVAQLKRLRLSSLEPNLITNSFLASLSRLDKFCDYFHLSLQSGCDKTLAAMNRKYNAKRYKEAIRVIREYFPESAIWSDVIVGFHGETDDDFEESYEFIKQSGIVKLHIFPFSPKRGTKAWEMDGAVAEKVKSLRAQRLNELDKLLYTGFLSRNIGAEASVLIEKKGPDGFYYGHTKNYILVKISSVNDITNEIIQVRLIDICEEGVVLGALMV